MRFLLLTLSFFLAVSITAQMTVMINFSESSSGDYDLIIKDILNDNGYDAFVNYGNSKRPFDLILEYKDIAHPYESSLKSIEITLYKADGKKIKTVNKKFMNIGMGIGNNFTKHICMELDKLFPEKFGCKLRKRPSVNFFNKSCIVHKIDSSTYSIMAFGAGVHNLEQVESAFLKKAGQYLNAFEYYHQNIRYRYTAHSPTIPTRHKAFMVYGIVKGIDEATPKQLELKDAPLSFKFEFPFDEKLSAARDEAILDL